LHHGAVAQLGERRVRNAKVEGSIPFRSTTLPLTLYICGARDVSAIRLTRGSLPRRELCSPGHISRIHNGYAPRDEPLHTLFQPIVCSTTHEPHGYEALTRGPPGSPLHFPAALFAAATAPLQDTARLSILA
jgi:hypothetical protein